MKLKGISKKEALELLKKDFSLNIDTSSSKPPKASKRKNNKKPTIIKKAKLVEGNSTDKIWNMFDTVAFKTKPTSRSNWRNQAKNTKLRICSLLITSFKRKNYKWIYLNTGRN